MRPPEPLFPFFFFNDTATTEIYTLSLHDALPISSFSPATIPTPMRMASKARPVARGSWLMRTTTGSSATTVRSVERDEALGGVDQVGEHHEAAVRHQVRMVEGDAALLTAVRAHEQLRA